MDFKPTSELYVYLLIWTYLVGLAASNALIVRVRVLALGPITGNFFSFLADDRALISRQ